MKFQTDAQACQLECDKSTTCTGTMIFTNAGGPNVACFSKSAVEVPLGSGLVSVTRTNNASATDNYYINKEVPNVQSIGDCQKACDGDKNCAGILFNLQGSKPYCNLKYTADPGGEMTSRVAETMVKAAPTPAATPKMGPPPVIPIVRYSLMR